MAVIGLGYNAAEALGIRWLASHQQEISQSLERLSTGQKLNRASDDPSGLISSENLKAEQKSVLAKIEANTQAGYRYSAIDGGLSVVSEMLNDLKGYVVTNANSAGLSDTEKKANQDEVDSIVDTLGQMSNTLTFKGELILQPYLSGGQLNALKSGGALNIVSGDLQGAQDAINSFTDSMSRTQAALGAQQKGLQDENNALATQNENLSAAISQIVDTDYASEVGSLVRSQALAEAATFAVQTARSLQAETVLALLKNQSDLVKSTQKAILNN
jgi:flagellin-like hook-associated protein FlgL